MNWQIDPQASRVAAEVFRPHRPVVRRYGRQYVIDSSAYGKVELIPVPPARFLVAAESPPQVLPAVEHAHLAADLLRHLHRNGLRAWKVVPGQDGAEALRHLLRDDARGDAAGGPPPWLPHACRLTPRGKLVGRARLPVAEQLAAMISAHGGDGPLAVLTGPPGVGRRTTLLAAAETLGVSAVELPLRRVLTDRVLQTPMECFLDTIVAAARHLSRADLLAVSDAQRIGMLPQDLAGDVLLELNRLPNVALLANDRGGSTGGIAGTVPLACPGLADTDEARDLLRRHEAELAFAGPALPMLCRAASAPGVGIIPGRLLYLARLAGALTARGDSSRRPTFSPDEVAPAIRIGQEAWTGSDPASEA